MNCENLRQSIITGDPSIPNQNASQYKNTPKYCRHGRCARVSLRIAKKQSSLEESNLHPPKKMDHHKERVGVLALKLRSNLQLHRPFAMRPPPPVGRRPREPSRKSCAKK